MKTIRIAAIAVLLVAGCKPADKPAASADKPVSPAEVEVVATDYAFQAPASLPAGRTTFRFVNQGKVRHELNVSRLKPGVSIDALLKKVRAEESVKDLTEGPVGVLFAKSGGRSEAGLTVELTPGEMYAVICIFRDSAGAKPHYDLGMYSVISVGEGQSVSTAPQAVVDTIVATDYAYQYPRTLAPGKHTFVMRNDGKMRHELSIVLLKKGVTFDKLREVEKARGDVEALFDGDFGLLHSRGLENPLGQLTIDMLPGREYVIACFFQDDEKSPPHYDLGMFGSITISGTPAT
jgi:plastocyanin/uncharacterized cupredoxin-like copper-binding protein